MVKVILFDFWGTLVENGVHSPTKQLKEMLHINIPFSSYITNMEKAMMTTQFNSIREALNHLCKEFRVECSVEKMDEMIGMWNKSWMLAQPYEEVEEMLQKLKEKYTLVLVSNTDNISIDQVLEKFQLRKYFDKIFLSYQMGIIKTDIGFFQKIVRELNVRKEDCVMVGDSIQSDIMAARYAGIKAILIDRKHERDYQLRITNLKELEEVLVKI